MANLTKSVIPILGLQHPSCSKTSDLLTLDDKQRLARYNMAYSSEADFVHLLYVYETLSFEDIKAPVHELRCLRESSDYSSSCAALLAWIRLIVYARGYYRNPEISWPSCLRPTFFEEIQSLSRLFQARIVLKAWKIYPEIETTINLALTSLREALRVYPKELLGADLKVIIELSGPEHPSIQKLQSKLV